MAAYIYESSWNEEEPPCTAELTFERTGGLLGE